MNRFCFIVFVILLLPTEVFATTVSGRISGDKLVWLSGTMQGDLLVPQRFDYAPNLPTTKRWTGGTFASGTNELILTSEEGVKVRVPSTLGGITYIVNEFSATHQDITIGGVNQCSTPTSRGMFTLVSDVFCIAQGDLKNTTPSIPFDRYRPILKISRFAIIDAFKGKPRGTYTGVISSVARYAFYIDSLSPILTYRNIPVSYAVQIRNEGSSLSKVSVVGDGLISPKYNTYRHVVNGETEFKLTAYGEFNTGLRFKFVNKKSDDYSLKATSYKDSTTSSVPYSISCLGCQGATELVSNGINRNPERWHVVEGKGESISFSLKVFYRDISVSDVLDDTQYRDIFTLMLEPTL